ncbi:hypothetical protein [Lelliottia amnigena]|uniref:hypothetical protein n=1 Tax=Lelliottia amnigena TaxID=61646 RepID=UPI0007439045|nr:hypothetical protein [Lelliottia amnigena]ATG01263.1 hypothetical protein CO697_06510 [Lelliottia amnigena]MCU7783224.1 hypothetical protein [Lelliottia amnigena]PEG63397.1 hypothetical protein CRH15_16770 [Lelliottia amnigena]QXA21558.1 hypothetical protein I6L74_19515 [Lelliottia amnigena]VDZ89211.1 Uncharacterised protein [Lelliottia amnigena]
MARSYPTDWAKFCDIEEKHKGFTYYKLNSKAKVGDVSRFAARYALAKDFKNISVDNSTADTTLGYEALMKALLAWSVSEAYYKLLSVNVGKYKYLTFTNSEITKIKSSLNATGSDLNTFFNFVKVRCEKKLRRSINKFLAGGDCEPLVLLATVRHVFSHGDLSANVEGVKPKSVNTIVEVLKNTILEKIDAEFTLLVKRHPNY